MSSIDYEAEQEYLDLMSVDLTEFENKCVQHWSENGNFNVLLYWRLKQIKNGRKEH